MFTERKTTSPFSEEPLFPFTFTADRSLSLPTLHDIARAYFPVFSFESEAATLVDRVAIQEDTRLNIKDLELSSLEKEEIMDDMPDPFTDGFGLPEALIEEETILQPPSADSSENAEEEPSTPAFAPSLAASKNLLAPLFPPFFHILKRKKKREENPHLPSDFPFEPLPE